MFRLLLLAVREVERRGSWEVPLAYFAFWTVKLGGYLPPLERCVSCGSALGRAAGFHFGSRRIELRELPEAWMRPVGKLGRELARVFASKRLDEMELPAGSAKARKELREAALDWIEHHVERRLQTREFLETT
jgi:recombinational DNA repair protein (RecF pathway)